MMKLQDQLAGLEQLKIAVSVQSLQNPNGPTAFDFGSHCGMIKGIELAMQELSGLQAKADEKEKFDE